MEEVNEAFYKHGSNLALYKKIPKHQDYWEGHWAKANLIKLFKTCRSGRLGEFEYPFSKYLPKDGVILEAGCGTAKYVCTLQARGYQVEGIDYTIETIERVRKADPSLDVRIGDIFTIDRPDDYYSAYISLGVLEHNFDGPQAGLVEAYRVLRPDGIALISVPYLNWPRRRLLRKVSKVDIDELSGGLRFYQDHLDINQFSTQINTAGFHIIELYPNLLLGGLVRDWRFGRWVYRHNFFSYRLFRVVKKMCQVAPRWIRRDLSHMMMFICRK